MGTSQLALHCIRNSIAHGSLAYLFYAKMTVEREREKKKPPICITMNTIAYNLCIMLYTAAICQNTRRRRKMKITYIDGSMCSGTECRGSLCECISKQTCMASSTMTSKIPQPIHCFSSGCLLSSTLKIV